MRELYAGSDLHGNNNLVGIIDGEGRKVFKAQVPTEWVKLSYKTY
jgi:hypothetical protein